MPTVKLNKEVFEKLVGKKLPLEELKDRISMLGTDLESIEDNQINVEVFPNRPDMLSEQGFARAFSSFIGVKTGLANFEVIPDGGEVIVDSSVSGVRPFTACAIVKNLKFDDEKIREIIQIQEKLHVTYGRNRKKVAIGIYPLEKIQLPITFKAKDPRDVTFRPLEFPNEVRADDILEIHPTGREYAHLLQGLDKFPFFFDASGKVLSMPPLINSHETGKVSEDTKDIFIECSGFDFASLNICLNIIVTTLADMGGQIYSMKLKYPKEEYITPDLTPRNMKLQLDYSNKILGLGLDKKRTSELLGRMGYGIGKFDEAGTLEVLVPAFRADIMHPIDLVEDIAIAYGYENFEEEIPNIATIGEESQISVLKKRIANIFVGAGLIETNTYHLSNENEQQKKMCCDIPIIPLANALTSDYNVLRAWMIPSMLKVFSENKHHDYPQNIFEIGTIFKEDSSTETGVIENDRLCVALCGPDADFTKIKQSFDLLFSAMDLHYDVRETEHESFISGRVARISVNGKDVAYIGEVHPQVLENFGLEMPVACFELNITEMLDNN